MTDAIFEDIRNRLYECTDGYALLADGFEDALVFPVKVICSDPAVVTPWVSRLGGDRTRG